MKKLVSIFSFFIMLSNLCFAYHKVTLNETSIQNKESYDVKYYRINLDINPTNKLITGKVLVRVEVVTDTLNQIDLDLMDNMQVNAVTSDSIPLTHSHVQNIITITLNKIYEKGEIIELEIEYSGIPSDELGFYGTKPLNFKSYNVQPMIYSGIFMARYWWPCKDYPAVPIEGFPYDKADSVDINITIPSNLYAVSNGILKNVTDEGSKKTYFWQERYSIATRGVFIAIYPYKIHSDWFKYSEIDSMEIQYFLFPDHFASYVNRFFSKTKEMLKFYSDLFGFYPFINEKLGIIEFMDKWNWGMQTNICFQRNLYKASDYNIEWTISHELAHQWWSWRNTSDFHHPWLDEGITDYSAALWFENRHGKESYHNFMKDHEYFGPGTIYWEKPEEEEPYELMYNKGPWVLHMLRHVVGDSIFFKILKTYATNSEYSEKLFTTEDFQQIAEEISTLDLNPFFEQWIYKEGYPKYSYSWDTTGNVQGNYDVDININQIQTYETIFQMPVDITIQMKTGDTTFVLPVNEKDNYFKVTVLEEPDSVLLDKDNWILCEIVQVPTAVEEISTEEITLPKKYHMSMNYPNPFNSETTIKIEIPKEFFIKLTLFDLLGREISILFDGKKSAGTYNVTWDGFDKNGHQASSGVYILRMESDGFSHVSRMLLLR